jgi:undecaprenyl pyrophosphate phosphatase UppP
MISYLQSVAIGLLQGVTELFPLSSLGHSGLVPASIGGSWESLVTQSATSTSETSQYLAVIVALHVATALALITFFPGRLGAHHRRWEPGGTPATEDLPGPCRVRPRCCPNRSPSRCRAR